ncbi:ABC transporter substrate-binding protein [Vibrio sp. TH_r3]|uniref:ABC transporter substrate-binding protein n=1 Tax=Vibrio sp. TH_r3 TaxID=3082084 RepID=UPI002954F0CB|nr:ABC transporter substrate-binding protein [Vibrio sp. TH_r3]MDV7105931.1 ABC transporter substrate-binding protein [Vibrio sp. TH_r3]
MFNVVIFSVVLSGVSYAQEVDKADPYDMIKAVSENLFDRLKTENSAIRDNPELLKRVVEEELMPYIDYRYAALKVLGSHLKKEKNRDNVMEFIDAFQGYLVTSYAQVLTLYSDQIVQFEPKKPLNPSGRTTSVKVDVIDNPRPDIKLEFKLRLDKKTQQWLAFDMVAEGISLLSTKQSEWNSTLRKEGIPAVSQELIRLSAQPVRFEGEGK